MNRLFLRAFAAAMMLALICPAGGQTYHDRLGTIIPAVVDAPFPFIPMAGTAQYLLSLNPAATLTVPAGARYAVVCAESSQLRYTTSGTTPTGSTGLPLPSATCVPLYGAPVLAAFQAFSNSGTLDVEYYQ